MLVHAFQTSVLLTACCTMIYICCAVCWPVGRLWLLPAGSEGHIGKLLATD